jgi:membrane-bound inhibitor of C-type lysozyme
MKKILLIIVALSLSLFANTYYYECQDGYDVSARLEGKRMTLVLPRKEVVLQPVVSASGAKYSDGEITLFTKGDDALLQLDNLGHLTCKLNRSKSSISKEKIKRYDFRAQGHEPEWHFMIEDASQVSFSYDDGKEVMHFKLPKARQSGDSTLYHYLNDNTTMMIEFHHRRCYDTLSDKLFDTIVSIKKNGRIFTGCGNASH